MFETAHHFTSIIHTELGEAFSARWMLGIRIGEDAVLKDRDVIYVLSAKRRA